MCSRSDPGFNVCLGNALEQAIQFFKSGAFNIPALDPFRIDYAEAAHSAGSSNFNLKSSLKDVDVIGLSTVNITRVATKFAGKVALKAEGTVKHLEISGNYKMVGQIVVLPIKGVGKVNISLDDITARVELRGEYFEKNNETFIDVMNFKVKLTPKHAKIFFENVFNGDAALSATINNFMNENWEVVINTLLPGYEERLGEKFREISNRIFKNVPMKMIFPE